MKPEWFWQRRKWNSAGSFLLSCKTDKKRKWQDCQNRKFNLKNWTNTVHTWRSKCLLQLLFLYLFDGSVNFCLMHLLPSVVLLKALSSCLICWLSSIAVAVLRDDNRSYDLYCSRYGDGSQYYTRRRYLELDTGQENVGGVAMWFAQSFYTPIVTQSCCAQQTCA